MLLRGGIYHIINRETGIPMNQALHSKRGCPDVSPEPEKQRRNERSVYNPDSGYVMGTLFACEGNFSWSTYTPEN